MKQYMKCLEIIVQHYVLFCQHPKDFPEYLPIHKYELSL